MAMTRPRNPLLFHSPHVVGYAFVKLYYDLLLRSPESLTAFYYDNGSTLVRPAATAGAMKFVTTHEAMREEFMSMDVAAVHVATVESKEFPAAGRGSLTVSVTGCLTGRRDGVTREFSQAFFLAPQQEGKGGGFFVRNDVLLYVGEDNGPHVRS